MCALFNSKRHDIGITDVSSDGSGTSVIGMMLARKEDDTPAYEEYDSKFLADQFYTGGASVSNVDPEKDMLFVGDDHRSGFGLSVYDDSDPKRYKKAIGCDASDRGRVILSNGATSVTVPKKHLFTSHTDASSHWTDDANAYDDDGTNYAYTTQDGVGWSDYLQLEISATSVDRVAVKVTRSDAHIDDCEVDAYYDSAWNSLTNPTFGQWNILAIGATKSVDKIRVRMHCDDSASTYYGRLNEAFLIDDDSTGQPISHATFNSEEYISVDSVVAKLNASGTAYSTVSVVDVAITSMQPMTISGTEYLFIFCGTSNNYWYMTTAEAFTESTATNKTYEFATLTQGTSPTIRANDSGNTIRSTTNPLNGGSAWSAQTTIDSPSYSITDMDSAENTPIIPKEDRTFYIDGSGNVQVMVEDQKTEYATTSGKNIWYWKGKMYIPCGDQGLLECDTDGSNPVWRNPANYCTDLSAFVGQVFGGDGDGFWNYIAVDNGTEVEIMKGRQETIDGSTSWVWHPYQEITLAGVEAMWISTVYQKRLWIASTDSSQNLFYIPLPTTYGDLENDANRDFTTGGTFEIPLLHGNFKNTDKAWVELTLTMGHSYDANIYWTAKYKKLGDTSWTNIGNFTGSASSMVETKYIDTTNKPFTPMMEFQFTGVTNDTTKTPVLLSYEANAVMYPPIKRLIHCVVNVTDRYETKQGLEVNQYDAIKTCLDNARSNPVWFIPARDIDGSTVNVKFLPVPRSIQRLLPTKMEKGKEQERHYHLLLMEQELS